MKESLGLTTGKDDGEFFMSLEDFLENFDNLDICNWTLKSNILGNEEEEEYSGVGMWHTASVDGKWAEGKFNHI